MNITYQYPHFLHLIIASFNSLTFILDHSQILFTLLFCCIPPTNFTVKRKAPKDRMCNKEKNKEEPRTKIPFVYRGGWPRLGRKFKFCLLSVLWSLRHRGTVANQSGMCTSHKHIRMKLFALYITVRNRL